MTDKPSEIEQPAEIVNPPALPAPLPLPEPLLGTLAREIAAGDLEDSNHLLTVLKRYQITEAQFDVMKQNPSFARTLATEIIKWNSVLNNKQRLGVQAAWYLEQGFAPLAARMMNKDESLAASVEAAKLFARIAGVGERIPGEAQAGEKVIINIDLGGGRTINITPSSPEQSGAGAIQIDGEGQSSGGEAETVTEV